MYMIEKDFDPKAVKALAIDLDGTLLRPDKTLSGRTLRALHSCMDRDIRIIITTGRAVDSGEQYRRQIGSTGPNVYYNGAEVVDVSAGKIIHTQFVDPEPVLFCAQLAKKMGLYFQAFFPNSTAEILMADNKTAESEWYEKSSGVSVITGDLEEQLQKAKAVIKAMFITPEENHAKLRSLIRDRYGDSVYLVQSTPVFLEILAEGVSKGAGLSHALEYINIKRENTIAFGDEENDLPMFDAAGFSAAPANAKEAVRNAALFRIPADTEDGVAAFLEERFKI
jgi:Cof subfamily protein (haloacid dehalogenase superfamily)